MQNSNIIEPEKKLNKTYTVIGIAAIVILVLLFIAVRYPKPISVPSLSIEPASFTLSVARKQKAILLYDPGAIYGGAEKQNVGENAEWSSKDVGIAFVSNAASLKGEILGQKPGMTKIRAHYGNLNAEADVRVTSTPLAVTCEPQRTLLKVEETTLVFSFFSLNSMGVPDYTYKWSGSDNLHGNNSFVIARYATPGVKKISVLATDRAGSSAIGECSITVEKR